MVDNVNPTSQFHPYQPERSVPNAERTPQSGLGGSLSKRGIDQSKIRSMSGSLGGQLGKARSTARAHPGAVLGGLAALVIGAGLMRKRRTMV